MSDELEIGTDEAKYTLLAGMVFQLGMELQDMGDKESERKVCAIILQFVKDLELGQYANSDWIDPCIVDTFEAGRDLLSQIEAMRK